MPEKFTSWWGQLSDALLFAVIGIAISLGQSYRDRERETSVIIGRSVSNGGLAMAAGIVLIWWPEIPLLAQIGVAAMLGSLGTAVIEKLALKYIETRAK